MQRLEGIAGQGKVISIRVAEAHRDLLTRTSPAWFYVSVRNSDLEAKKLFAGMVVKTTEPNDQEPLEETQQRMPEREVMRLMTLQPRKIERQLRDELNYELHLHATSLKGIVNQDR